MKPMFKQSTKPIKKGLFASQSQNNIGPTGEASILPVNEGFSNESFEGGGRRHRRKTMKRGKRAAKRYDDI
jgi:hypothetical protein